jgi:hypothetical protein
MSCSGLARKVVFTTIDSSLRCQRISVISTLAVFREYIYAEITSEIRRDRREDFNYYVPGASQAEVFDVMFD